MEYVYLTSQAKPLRVLLDSNEAAAAAVLLATVAGAVGSFFILQSVLGNATVQDIDPPMPAPASKDQDDRETMNLNLKRLTALINGFCLAALTSSAVVVYAQPDAVPIWQALVIALVQPLSFYVYDALFSSYDSVSRNMQILDENGFSASTVAACSVTNGFTFSAANYTLGWFFRGYEPHFDWKVLATVGCTLVGTDICFRWVHKNVLHHYFPWLHHIHHCVRFPGMTGDNIFHPLDYAIEFGVGFISVLAAYGATGDKFNGLVCSMVVSTWYHLDHDEAWNLDHVMHHRIISGYYTAYFPVHDGVQMCGVKEIMKANAKAKTGKFLEKV